VAGETLLLPLLGVAIGIWANPLDPLWTRADFPWIWFAPVVLSMRYGPFPGLAGAFILVAAWFAFNVSGWLPGEFPKLNFIGGLILVMLSGEFSSVWLSRARRSEGVNAYLDQRLEHLTHQYYLLRLSHDRLEQDLIGRPMSMRDALGALQDLASTDSGEGPLPGADRLLRLLAQYCQIEAAALHAAENADGFAASPVARIGQTAGNDRLDADDPLLAHALEKGCLAHVGGVASADAHRHRYVIAAPLVTFSGERLGVLLVERLPFFALHEETLQTLNLLLGYYTDGLVRRQLAAPVQASYPDCPPDFAAELQRLWRVREESRIGSVLVALEFRGDSHDHLDDLATTIRRQRRALDVNWLLDAAPNHVLITLMPLAGQAAAEGYLARIEAWVRQTRGGSLEECGILPHVLRLDETPPVTLLHHLFTICHASAETRALRPGA
jgi:hypothetical protein